METIVNRVAESGIQVLDLANLPGLSPLMELDIEPFLFGGLILREKDFRQHVKLHDWEQYRGAAVAVTCSVDTIIPTWAFMLVASRLEGIAHLVAAGTRNEVSRYRFRAALQGYNWGQHEDRIVVVKGCGTGDVPVDAFVGAMNRLQGVASKVMYGEPCSSVPLWRRPKQA